MTRPSARFGMTVALAMVIGVAMIGFIQGTSPVSYDLMTPETIWAAPAANGVPTARSYREEGEDRDDGGARTAKACVDCHDDRVSPVGRGRHIEHPIGVPVGRNVELSGLNALGGRIEVDEAGRNIVICRSCHRPHNADIQPRLVQTEAEGLCAHCHADHDSRRSQHPVAGSVSPGTLAVIDRLGGKVDGGALGCASCHSAHGARSGTLLRTDGAGNESCGTCHPSKRQALSGGGHGGQFCTDCHGAHRAPAHLGRGPSIGDGADAACVDCHMGGGRATRIDPAAGHPMWVSATEAMREAGHEGTVNCTTCHVAHGQGRLLAAGTVLSTCLDCHPDKAALPGTKHDAAVVAVGGEDQPCLSCHPVHGGQVPAPPPGVNPASGACLSCHDGRTDARAVTRYDHPRGMRLTLTGLPARYSGAVPYFGPEGERTDDRAVGEITCQTCHDPHRWTHDAEEHPGDVEGSEQNSFLRDPHDVAQFCAVCHGTDGRPRFRFFHDAVYRDKTR